MEFELPLDEFGHRVEYRRLSIPFVCWPFPRIILLLTTISNKRRRLVLALRRLWRPCLHWQPAVRPINTLLTAFLIIQGEDESELS